MSLVAVKVIVAASPPVGLIYHISALNLGLTCEDLLRVAGE